MQKTLKGLCEWWSGFGEGMFKCSIFGLSNNIYMSKSKYYIVNIYD